jgi:hypothetical protein
MSVHYLVELGPVIKEAMAMVQISLWHNLPCLTPIINSMVKKIPNTVLNIKIRDKYASIQH